MAGPWEQYQKKPQPEQPAGPWQQYQQPADTQPQGYGVVDAVTDFGKGALAGLANTVVQGGDLIRRGLGMERIVDKPDVKALTTAPDTLPGKAGRFTEQAAEFFVPGSIATKATKGAGLLARAGAQAVAGGGVAALQTGGDPTATAISAATGAAAPLIGAGANSLVRKVMGHNPRPLSAGDMAIAEQFGIPLNQGARTGSAAVQRVEKVLGSTVAPDLYEGMVTAQRQGTTRGASTLADGFKMDEFSAGDSVLGKLLSKAKQLDTTSRAAYDDLHAFADEATQTLGTDQASRAMGKTIQTVQFPVNMTSFQRTMDPVYKFVSEKVPILQRDSDPAFTYLKQLMESGENMNAMKAEEYLSHFKEMARQSKIPELRDKAQGLAALAIKKLQPEIDKALSVNPDAQAALQFARQTWRSRADVFRLVEELGGDVTGNSGQTAIAKRLLRPADASYPQLQKVLEVAPEAKDDLAKAYLGNVFSKVRKGEDFTNPQEAANLFNQIGKRTKEALFTPEQVSDIRSFLEVAKRVNENPNTSGTGFVNALLKLGVLVTNPIKGTAAIGLGRRAASVLYSPDGAAALKSGLNSTDPSVASRSLQTIQSLIQATSTQQ